MNLNKLWNWTTGLLYNSDALCCFFSGEILGNAELFQPMHNYDTGSLKPGVNYDMIDL